MANRILEAVKSDQTQMWGFVKPQIIDELRRIKMQGQASPQSASGSPEGGAVGQGAEGLH